MSIGLNREELTKAINASEAEILEELQFSAEGKTTVSASKQSMALYCLLSRKTVEVIAANNQRIADQLAAAGVVL
ncbi:hypothetical protein ES703_31335 [subsurface metagenome]